MVPTLHALRYTQVSTGCRHSDSPYLALDEKHADMQTFQVCKTWKV